MLKGITAQTCAKVLRQAGDKQFAAPSLAQDDSVHAMSRNNKDIASRRRQLVEEFSDNMSSG